MQLLTLNDDGQKEVIGRFILGDTIRFINAGGREYSKQEFIDAFNESYPLDNGKRVSLKNPEEYYNNLPERFTSQVWTEK